MTHQEAVNELAVERYLLEELDHESRNSFEEHMFDCAECAASVKAGVLFAQAARKELQLGPPRKGSQQREKRTGEKQSEKRGRWIVALIQPRVLATALAASLAVVAYQSAVVLPHMRVQAAALQAPTVLRTLVLANPGARSAASIAQVVVPQDGAYLLSVDIPSEAGAIAYRCSLYAQSGAVVWRADIPAEQARETVTLQVPAIATGPGTNALLVQAIDSSQGDKLSDLARYSFKLSTQ